MIIFQITLFLIVSQNLYATAPTSATVEAYTDGSITIIVPYNGGPDAVGFDYSINNDNLDKSSTTYIYEHLPKYGSVGMGTTMTIDNKPVQLGDTVYYRVLIRKGYEWFKTNVTSYKITELRNNKTSMPPGLEVICPKCL